MAIVPAEYCAIRGRFVPSRRPRPHRTKEARRVESAGFLRGYSRAAFGRFAIVRDFIRGRLRNAWQAAPLLDLEWIADKQKSSQAPQLVCPLSFQREQCWQDGVSIGTRRKVGKCREHNQKPDKAVDLVSGSLVGSPGWAEDFRAGVSSRISGESSQTVGPRSIVGAALLRLAAHVTAL